MIVPGALGAAQRPEPRLVHQRQVSGLHPSRHSARVVGVGIARILGNLLVAERQRALGQLFDPLLRLAVNLDGSAIAQKTVVGVGAALHRPGAIQFVKKNCRQQMIDGKRVVRMCRQGALKVARGRVIIELIVMLEAAASERVILGGQRRARLTGRRCFCRRRAGYQSDNRQTQ